MKKTARSPLRDGRAVVLSDGFLIKLSLVDHADGLAFASRDGLRGDEVDARGDAEHGAHGVHHMERYLIQI